MNILFLHRSVSGQFKHLAKELAKNSQNNVVFITDDESGEIEGVKKVLYKTKIQPSINCHQYLKNYEEAIIHAQATAETAENLAKQGFVPDVIYSFPWGNGMFMKDLFKDVKMVSYCEWFYNSDSEDIKYTGITLNENDKSAIRCKNSKLLTELDACDAGLTPTEWQKSQFPKEYQNKITVMHDGIDTDFFKPDDNAKFLIKDKNIEFTSNDEVITYATRGMEPLRGFPQFIEAIEILLENRPNAQVIIAGEDVVCYGQKLPIGTYKQKMLQQCDLDMNRVHFVGKLSYDEYLSLLQISSAHIYLTAPYVLSWSFLEAMACECPIIASSTKPVQEFMSDNYNGLLTDFFDVEEISEKIIFALDNKEKMKVIRKNARQTILDKCSLKSLLLQQIDFMKKILQK